MQYKFSYNPRGAQLRLVALSRGVVCNAICGKLCARPRPVATTTPPVMIDYIPVIIGKATARFSRGSGCTAAAAAAAAATAAEFPKPT